MYEFEKYKFLSDIYSKIYQMRGKTITRMMALAENPSSAESPDRYAFHIGPSTDRDMWFSYIPFLFYIEIADFGVLSLRRRGRQHQSIGAAYLPNFPSSVEMRDEISTDRPLLPIEADDPVYSRPYFAGFLGRRIAKIEAILGLRDGRPTARRNERGLRITDDRGSQFLVGWGILHAEPDRGMRVIKPEEANTDPSTLTYKEI